MFPRAVKREKGQFKTTLPYALGNVETSLRLFGQDSRKPVTNVVLSSNCTLGVNAPDDPGVAVWFTWDGMQVCIPVDRYATAAANLQAIHHVLEARRVELRHGTLSLVRATMKGFVALPGQAKWWDILHLPSGGVTRGMIESAYRELAKKHHPDVGGDAAQMAALNRARTEGLAALERC
jgi:hypothetical protein